LIDKKAIPNDKTITTGKINQSLKLDSINDQFRSTTEHTSSTIVPSINNNHH